jgi:ssDNA-binding Zn-finger/Zn-ribbon topoisomerase 1
LCPNCGNLLVLKDGKYGIFYGCVKWSETGCKGAHNCNKLTAAPQGTPGDDKTRKARLEAYAWFSRVWKEAFSNNYTNAHNWLRRELSLTEDQCRLGLFDLPTCERVIRLSRLRLGDLTRFDRIEDEII